MKKRLRRHLAAAKLGWCDQGGFNLVGALIMMSLIVMAIALVARSQGLTVFAKRTVRASSAYEEIIQPFQSAVVEKLKAHFKVPSNPGCPKGETFASGVIGDGFRFNYTASLPPKVNDPASLTAVKAACRAPRFQDGDFKFCVEIFSTATGRVTDNNMSSMNDIIAELDISLLNVQDNQGVTCAAFHRGQAAYSVRIDYTLHWLYSPKNKSSPLHKKRRGSFYAIL